MRRTREGFFGGLALDVRDVALGRVPDVLHRIVIGRVRRQMNRRDALQQLTRLVQVGQRFRMVEAGVVQDDRDLLCLGFSLEPVQGEDRLLGVLVPSIGYSLTFLLVSERAPKKDWDVFCRSTDSLVRCPLGSHIRRVSASCSKRTSSAV